MSLGYDRQTKIVALNDSARLIAYLYDEKDQLYSYEDLAAVTFTIQRPASRTDDDLTDPKKNPEYVSPPSQTQLTEKFSRDGEVLEDGTGVLVLGGVNETDRLGHHIVVATFQLIDGTIKSTRCDFEVFDPFAVIDTPIRVVADGVWTKLEDCFDAEDEGPWVQDMTLHFFREEKMEKFINDALFDINYQNPPTNIGVSGFVGTDNVPTADYPLLVQAIFVQVLRHIMRSYVEQPMPTGVQIAWQDRRDYLERWQSMYQLELEQYMRWLALWKRGFLQLGHSRLLVSAKAGRLIPAPMRARSVGRGYW
jgi:hypothetical protein